MAHELATGRPLAPPLVAEVQRALLEHLQDHYQLYGAHSGVRSARKHIGWYVRALPGGEALRQQINAIDDVGVQWRAVRDYFQRLADRQDRLPAPDVRRRPAPERTDPHPLS